MIGARRNPSEGGRHVKGALTGRGLRVTLAMLAVGMLAEPPPTFAQLDCDATAACADPPEAVPTR